jgi:hypothetical protein
VPDSHNREVKNDRMTGADTHEEPNPALERAVATVATWLRTLIDPAQVVELRALRMHDGEHARSGGHGYTAAGTFRGSELEVMARAALLLSGNCQGVYYTLNPLRPEKFVRQAPRVQRAAHGQTAGDADVLERRWLLVDIDPVKPTGHADDSATDAEKARTLVVANAVREYLASEGWPAPILCDSGNGHHLLYKLGEPYPVTPESLTPAAKDSDPVRRMLLFLADKFNGSDGVIDTTVCNPARIVKFPGTLACKGSGEGERVHRRARVLEVPE